MPSGLIALLDDVAMIAKLAAASADDIAGATAKAGAKAASAIAPGTRKNNLFLKEPSAIFQMIGNSRSGDRPVT